MIRFACPQCGARLSARDEIAGQTRHCPKCNAAVVVPPPGSVAQDSGSAAAVLPESVVHGAAERGSVERSPAAPAEGAAAVAASTLPEAVAAAASAGSGAAKPPEAHTDEQAPKKRLPLAEWPQRLNRNNCYLIVGRHKIVAAWQNNGEGWMLKSGSSWISAIRNRDQLPTQGDFVLVELKFSEPGQPRKLVGLSCYKLSQRWALTTLDKGDDQIMGKIVEPGCLNKDQKAAVRTAIKEMFMHQAWEDAHEVWQFLNNADYHSPGVA